MTLLMIYYQNIVIKVEITLIFFGKKTNNHHHNTSLLDINVLITK